MFMLEKYGMEVIADMCQPKLFVISGEWMIFYPQPGMRTSTVKLEVHFCQFRN